MQYIKPTLSPQRLYFQLPVQVTQDILTFTSYENNFQVQCVPIYSNLNVEVTFSLSTAQVALLTSGTTFKVQYGSAVDYVQSDVPSSNVIQYD